MKKILSFLLLISLIFPIGASAKLRLATLINKDTGIKIVINVGTWPINGNWELFTEQKLGYSVVTDFAPRLSISITSIQATIPVTSMTTKDGHTLVMSDFGQVVYLTIEPGANKEEIVMCTGISSLTFNGCTRGLAFYGTSTATVSSNRQPHQSGSSVILSNVHYVYQQFVDRDTNQIVAGIKSFTSNATNFTYLPISTTTPPVSDNQLATKLYVDNIGASGITVSNASTTQGIQAFAGTPVTLGVKVATTSGMYIDSNGAVAVRASSTAAIGTDANGIYFKGLGDNNTWTGNNTYSGTTTLNGINTLSANTTIGGLSMLSSTSAVSVTLASSTTLTGGTYNYYATTTTAFTPNHIAVRYNLKGTSGSGTATYSVGEANYIGTTVTNGYYLINNSTSATIAQSTIGFSGVQSAGSGGAERQSVCLVDNITSTSFTIKGYFTGGSSFGTGSFSCYAIATK